MLKFHRIASGMAVVALFSSLLAACGSNANNESSNGQAQQSQAAVKDVTIKWWDWNPQQDEWRKAAIKDFESKNPHIKVELTSYKDEQYWLALKTAIQGGETPDVFGIQGANVVNQGSEYIEMGGLQPLEGLIDTASISKDVSSDGYYQGKMYTVPDMIGQSYVVFYNKDIFKQYNLTPPAKLSDMDKINETLSKNGVTPFAFGGGHWVYNMFAYVQLDMAMDDKDWMEKYKAGEEKLSNSKMAAALDKWKEWGSKGYLGKDYSSVSYDAAYLTFSSQKAAMVISGSWDVGTVLKQNPDLNLGAFYFPDENGKITATGWATSHYGLGTKTKNKDAAVTFLKYMMTPESVQIRFDLGGGIPLVDGVSLEKNKIVEDLKHYDVLTPFSLRKVMDEGEKQDGAYFKFLEAKSPLVWKGDISTQDFVKQLEDMMEPSKLKGKY